MAKEKYNTFVITITSTAIFFIWKYLGTLFAGNSSDYIVAAIGFATSLGAYKAIVFALQKAIGKFEIVKKYFLGSTYINGIWFGYYIGASNEKRCFIEYIEQDFESIKIRGHSYNSNHEFHSSWSSNAGNIDPESGKLYYTYSVIGLKENINNIGCAEFDFERRNASKYPCVMQGFSTDIQIGKRIKSYEEKVVLTRELRKKNEIELMEICFAKYKDM